jgi:aryl-alcohol dehydrogenase-like predicted oxidoreductase
VLAQGQDMIPIPGTKRRKYLEENAAAVEIVLSKKDLENIEEIVSRHPDVGNRYSEGSLKLVDN